MAQEAGVSVKEVTDLGRNQSKDDLSNETVERIFVTPVGKAASAPSGEGRAVFKVTAATMPAFVSGTPTDTQLVNSLRTALSDDVLGEFLTEVQKSAGVSVNQRRSGVRSAANIEASMTEPAHDAVRRAYEAGRPSLLGLTLVADLETPVAAFQAEGRTCRPRLPARIRRGRRRARALLDDRARPRPDLALPRRTRRNCEGRRADGVRRPTTARLSNRCAP